MAWFRFDKRSALRWKKRNTFPACSQDTVTPRSEFRIKAECLGKEKIERTFAKPSITSLPAYSNGFQGLLFINIKINICC